MNKHTKRKYPNASKHKAKPFRAEFKDMSLFNELQKRVSELEGQLAEREQRIRILETALEKSRKVNQIAIQKGFASGPYSPERAPIHSRDLNSLSRAEEEKLFAHLSVPEDYSDGETIERAVTPWRDRIMRPVAALFRK